MNSLPNSLTAIHRCNRRKFIQYGSLALGTSIVAACSNTNSPQTQTSPTTASSPDAAGKLDKVTFGTNWVAEAEHGGFYQAIALRHL